MKTISTRSKLDGTTRMTIELAPGEKLATCPRGQVLVAIDPDAFYKLGEPMHEDVFAGHILAGISRTLWCTLEQKWID